MKDGIIIINKPMWYTSFDVVARLRKIFNTKKIGHTGTLDPMATGVLVVCVNKATSLVNVLTSEDKIYRTTIRLGIKTDTADMAGTPVGTTTSRPQGTHLSDISKQIYEQNLEISNNSHFDFTQEQIEETLKRFIGKQLQTPPIYSSIKVDGKKLYEYAREGKEVEIPSREIEVFDIYDIEWNGQNEIAYTVHCSKGTYIRTLNEDIAKALGTIGTTKTLQRIKTGDYSLEDAVELENISENDIISLENIFEKSISINEDDLKQLINGISIDVIQENGIYKVYSNDKFIGLGTITDNKLKRYIIS